MARSKQSKSKQMKIKQPSLKGMKNTSYLGHFAQDEFIKQGHNFSGRVEMSKFTGTPDIERFAVSNPFEAQAEFARRQEQVKQEIAAIEDPARESLRRIKEQMPTRYAQFGDSDEAKAAQLASSLLSGAYNTQYSMMNQQLESLRGRRKKFLEEL